MSQRHKCDAHVLMRGEKLKTAPGIAPLATLSRRENGFFLSLWTHLQKDWCCALLLALVAVLIHSPALAGEFIWDDNYLAHDNPLIKSPLFIFEIFRHYLFLDSLSAHYRPVQNLSLIADYFFWNDETWGFHLTNIILHALNGVLLYFLLRRLLPSFFEGKSGASVCLPAAFLVAALWTVHPVHSAAVDYISGRADSLAFLFSAAGWIFFLRAREAPRRGPRVALFGAAAVAGLFALCSRETAGLWLIIFLLHTLIFTPNLSRAARLAVLSGCLALFAAYCGLRQLPERRPAGGPRPDWSAPVRTVLMLRALGDYGRLMVFPANLHMERTVVDVENYESHSAWRKSAATEYLSIGGLLLISLLANGCRWRGAGQGVRLFGAVWFAVGFLPISNFLNLNATVAEHWLYFPSVGLLIFAAGCALDLPSRFRGVLTAGAFLAVLALSLRSLERSRDWISPERFYKQTIAAGGNSTRVSLNLGQLYVARGEYGRGEACFREILAGTPDFAIAKVNLANALFQQGRKKEAESLFAAATAASPHERKGYPHSWLAAVNLAGIQRQKHHFRDALKTLEQARKDYPGTWEIVSLEAELLRETKASPAARKLVADFARDHWWHYGAWLALGRIYAESGDAGRAEAALQHASRLDVHEVDALNLIVRMRIRQNRLAEACRAQKRAVARQPDAPRQYILLSDILEKMGQTAEAKEAIANVARLKAIGRGPNVLVN